MKSFLEYLAEAEAKLKENATAGATSAANVAALPIAFGALGPGFDPGFDPDGDHGIYSAVKKKERKDKVLVLRRPR